MKNGALFLLLIGLLTFTYYHEEMGHKFFNKSAKDEQSAKLLELKEYGALKEVKLLKTHLILGEKGIHTQNGLMVAPEKWQGFLRSLGPLRIKRGLNLEEIKQAGGREKFFPFSHIKMSFVFEKDIVHFELGKKLDFEQSFYVAVKTKKQERFYLAFDSSVMEGVFKKEIEHRADNHYRKFLSLFHLKEDFFLEHRLGRLMDLGEDKITHVDFNNFRNRSFQLNFLEGTTTPTPPQGYQVNTEALSKWRGELEQIHVKKTILPTTRPEGELGNITFKSAQKEYQLNLYQTYQGQHGYFVQMDQQGPLYQIEQKGAKVILNHYQAFWHLSPIKVKNLNQVALAHKDQWNTFRVEHDKDWSFTCAEGSCSLVPDQNRFRQLFNYLEEFPQRMSWIERGFKAGNTKLDFKIKEGRFSLQKEGQEIQLIDWARGVIIHYIVGIDSPISSNWQDYFK